MEININEVNNLTIDQLLDLKIRNEKLIINNSNFEITFKHDEDSIWKAMSIPEDKVDRMIEEYKKIVIKNEEIKLLISAKLIKKQNREEIDENELVEIIKSLGQEYYDCYLQARSKSTILETLIKKCDPKNVEELIYISYMALSK